MSIVINNTGTLKPRTSKIHTTSRVEERYGISISEGDYNRLALNIRMRNDAFFIHRLSKTRSVWLVRLNQYIAVAIYNSKQTCITTMLNAHYAKQFFNDTEDDRLASDDNMKHLENRIRKQRHVMFIHRSSKTCSMWLGRLDGVNTFALFNPIQNKIFKILPSRCVRRYLNGNSIYNPTTGKYDVHD